MAAYAAEEFDYNTLYAGLDAALYAVDFFKLNKYWGAEITMPTLPFEQTAFEYNGNTYDFTDPANRLIPADKPWTVQRSPSNYWYAKADGTFAYSDAPRTTFATEAEAQAFADAVAAAGASPIAGVVKLGYYIVERFSLRADGTRESYQENYGGDNKWNTAASIHFATLADADAQAKVLAGEGAIQQADGSWRSVVADANGKKWDYQPMWEPMVNDAYQGAVEVYQAEIRALLEGFSIISKDDQKMSFLQYVPTVGPRQHHTLTGSIQKTGLAVGEGFLVHNVVSANSYLSTSSVPAAGVLFADILMAGGAGDATSSGGLFTIRDAQYNVTVDENGTHLKGTHGYQGFPTVSFSHTIADRHAPFHFTVTSTIEGASHAIKVGVNGTEIHSGTYADTNSGYTMLGYGQNGKAMPEYYAIRFFNRELTADEQLVNRFADVAKFYRLEMNGYAILSSTEKRAAQEALAAVALGSLERDEVQAMLNAVVAEHYVGVTLVDDAAKNAAFLELAVLGALDLAPIENLDAASREAVVCDLLATFDTNYAVDGCVIAAYYADATNNFSMLTFAGYQVRLDSGSQFANYAGVRAVYDVDLERIEEYCKSTGKQVALAVGVTVGDETAATLQLVYKWNAETEELELAMSNNSATGEAVSVVEREVGGKTVQSFFYTVTFKGEDFTKELLTSEFGYLYGIALGGDVIGGDAPETTYLFNVKSQNFGATVSAAEVYSYFNANGYADDAMVAAVIAKLAE